MSYLPNPELPRAQAYEPVSNRFAVLWLLAILVIPTVLLSVVAYAVPLRGIELMLEAIR